MARVVDDATGSRYPGRPLNPGNDELVLTPRLISENTDWSRTSVREHLVKLRDHGMVAYYDEDAGIYRLSDKGRAWLQGEISTDEIED